MVCLVDHGYRGTTMQRVQDVAGVSRGTLTHHFRSIPELLVAAIQHIAAEQLAEIEELLAGGSGPHQPQDAVALLHPVMSGPSFIAGMELWMAARTDDVLRESLLPEERRLGHRLRELLGTTVDRADLEVLLCLLRGLAITSVLRSDSSVDARVLGRWAGQVSVASDNIVRTHTATATVRREPSDSPLPDL